MSAHTCLGTEIWDLEWFTDLDSDTRILWLGLYTTAEAKRIVPGLWHGSIYAMADAAHLNPDVAVDSLAVLIERDLAEYDRKLRVLRLTKLPDASESPANGNVIRGWYRRFQTVPACAVRDAHVATLLWIMEEWCRVHHRDTIGPDHIKAWNETFAHVVIPSGRSRGVRNVKDEQAGVRAQPGLFDPPIPPKPPRHPELLGDGSSSLGSEESSPVSLPPVDNSDSLSQLKEIRDSGSGASSPSNGSSNRLDQEPSGSGSGSGSRSGSIPERGGGSGGGARLTLVPLPPPHDAAFGVDRLLELVGKAVGGQWALAHATSERARLGDELAAIARLGFTESDLAVVGDWMRATALSPRGARELLTVPGQLATGFSRAMAWREETAERARSAAQRSAELKEAREKAGV